jgi:hypothetical protein
MKKQIFLATGMVFLFVAFTVMLSGKKAGETKFR